MTTAVLPQIGSAPPNAVAPWRHTLSLIGFFVLMAAAGAVLQYRARPSADLVAHRPNVALLYVSLLAGEWGLVYYVWKGGLRRSGITLFQLVGGRWNSVRAAYNHAQYLPERRNMMQWWADYLDEASKGK